MIETFDANIGAEGIVKVVRYCDHLAEVRRIQREHQSDLRDAAQSAADERTWQMTQRNDFYGSY